MNDNDIDSLESVEVLDKLFQEEIEKWHKEEIDPGGVNVNVIYLDAQFHSLFDFLVAEGVIDGDKANLFYKKFILKRLRELRKEILPQVRQARIASGIIGPNGRPFDLGAQQ